LAEHFLAQINREEGATKEFGAAALRRMAAYSWPGNVRELKNTIERIVLLEAEDEIRLEHLPIEMHRPAATAGGGDPFPSGAVRPLAAIEKLAIEHALRVCDGNKTRAAQQLGISRQTLRTKLKEFAIADDSEDAEAAS